MADNTASHAPAKATESDAPSTFRKAPADTNRIPGSAASMKVQERSKAASFSSSAAAAAAAASSLAQLAPSTSSLRNKTAIQAMQPFLDSSTTADSPIQPTDIQLLTTSILSNQERQRVILFYQEKLIESSPSLNDLKKSLLFLSSSSWGQILEERKLVEKCSYPPCNNPSPSTSRASGTRGKFRISLRNNSVKAVEDLDLGEAGNTYDDLRDYFCSKPCYARSEWILRWVLSDKEIGLLESGHDGNKEGAGGGGSALGGKWQKLTSQSGDWEQVELLEDIEREQGVNFADDDADRKGLLRGVEEEEGQKEEKRKAGMVKGTSAKDESQKSDKEVCNLLGNLTIIERSKATTSHSPTPPTAPEAVISHPSSTTITKASIPSRQPYTVDVPNTLGARFTNSTTPSNHTTAEANEDLETDLEAHERELAHILRFASLASGSKPRPRNTTIRFDNSSSTAPSPISTQRNGKLGRDNQEEEDGESDEPVLDPKAVAERSEIRRLMDLAMDVRRDQRELGLLD